MKKPTIIMNVVNEDIGYSATVFILNKFIGTQGDDFHELKTNILEAVNLAFEEEGLVYQGDEILLRPNL